MTEVVHRPREDRAGWFWIAMVGFGVLFAAAWFWLGLGILEGIEEGDRDPSPSNGAATRTSMFVIGVVPLVGVHLLSAAVLSMLRHDGRRSRGAAVASGLLTTAALSLGTLIVLQILAGGTLLAGPAPYVP